MIPRAYRILLPCPVTVEQEQVVGGGNPFAPSPATEHARLTDSTADLWRELVHLCMETP